MFYLIKGIKRIITDYVIGSELSKLILELENKKNILDNEGLSDFKFKIAHDLYDKIFEEYDTKTTIYSNQNLVVTYRKMLEDKLLVKNIESNTESNTESSTEPNTESSTESNTESSTESNTESNTVKVELSINKNNINKKKSKHSNKFRKISIQQNKTICFNCGRDTHKQNECTESTDIYGTLLV
jgi:hypothetical protein